MNNEKRAQDAKDTREWRKAHGFCIRCGHEKAEPGKIHCLVCKMDVRERAREYYRNLPDDIKKERAERKKQIKAQKKAAGICIICSKPAYKNHVHCYEHYIRHNNKAKRYERKRYPYHPSGVCRICGKYPESGHKLCSEHYRQYADRMIKLNKERSRAND